jgi:hypothetical protein
MIVRQETARLKHKKKSLVEAVIDDGQFDTPPPQINKPLPTEDEGGGDYSQCVYHIDQALRHLRQCSGTNDPSDDPELDDIITALMGYREAVTNLRDM